MPNQIFTFGYGNLTVKALDAILAEHPDTVVVDTRRFPKGWSNEWSRASLENRYGDRYRFAGILLGNGAKGDTTTPAPVIGNVWRLNVKDWDRLDCFKERYRLGAIGFLAAGLDDLRTELGERSPLFMCCEGRKKLEECHRLDIANTASTTAWYQWEIVHL